MAGLVLPCRFQNSPLFTSPFTANGWLWNLSNTAWQEKSLSGKHFIILH
jgi:hypothetical protein